MDNSLQIIPPRNIEAEMSVLGAMLIEREAICKVKEILSADSFYREAHKKIFIAISDLHQSDKEVDLVILAEELTKRGQMEEIGGVSYIDEILNCTPTATNADYYARIVKKKAVLRKLIGAATEIIQMVYEEREDLDLILAKSQKLFSDVLAQADGENMLGKLEIGQGDLKSHFSHRETPFEELNRLLGGFFGGELIVVGGRPGMGKTSFVLECLRHTAIKNQRPVIYFGSETTKQIIYSRLLSSICDVDIRDLRRGKIANGQKLTAAHKEIDSAPIYLLAIKDKISAVLLVSQVRTLMKKIEDLGLVIVENIQQLIWPEKFKTRKEEVDVILEALKALAIETNAPIILSSQINREVDERENKRPLPSDLKETGRIEELADKILLIYRENYYAKSTANLPEQGEIIIAKGGPSEILPLKFYGAYLSWRNA